MNWRRILFVVPLFMSLMLAACSPAAEGSTPTAASTPSPAPTPTVYTNPRLMERPLVFFGPLPKPEGSLDFMDLFSEDAGWQAAASHVQVFNLYGGWAAHFPWEPPEASDEELQTIIADIKRRGMALGFEASPLVATDECGRGIEGFFGPEEGLAIVNRLQRLGATVSYVSLDEPFVFGHIYDGQQACHWPPEKIARQVQDYIGAIHSIYPDAVVGDVEPLWSGMNPDEIVSWMDTYKTVTGSKLPFLHLDLDYSRADWPTAAKSIEDAAHARGIEFGIFYTGDARDATDAQWLNKAFDRARTYELVAGGKPDHIKFQSWNDRPDYVLPESKPDTFTGFVKRYFNPRPALSLELGTAGGDGAHTASGTLTDAGGAGLPDAQIQLTMKALDGPGLVAEYTVKGRLDAWAAQAVAGFRVNTECDCQAASEFKLYQMSYMEGKEGSNQIVNSRFAQGLRGWGLWGSGLARLEASDRGGGTMLHVKTAANQDAAINSTVFDVTPGADYTFTVLARVPPGSSGGGYFTIMFLDPRQEEIGRQTIPLAPGAVPMLATLTDAQGNYTLKLGRLPEGHILVEANYAGNDEVWPAYASGMVGP